MLNDEFALRRLREEVARFLLVLHDRGIDRATAANGLDHARIRERGFVFGGELLRCSFSIDARCRNTCFVKRGSRSELVDLIGVGARFVDEQDRSVLDSLNECIHVA